MANVSNVDTFNLWCDSTYAANYPTWISNKSYDIWYSLDGETYYTNDALKFTDAVSAYEDGVYVKKDGTEQSGVVHAVELGGVMAQYIAIAVTKFAPGTTQNEMVFHEVSAEGNVVDIPVSVDGLQLNKFDSSKVRLVGTVSNTKVKEVGFKVDMTWATSMSENSKFAAIKSVKYDGWFATEEGTSKEVVLADGHKNDKIIDGTTNPGYTDGEADAADESYTGGVAGTLKKTSHFVDGVYSYSKTENYSDGYYGVLFLNLDALSEIDTLNLWCDSIYAEQYPGWVSNSDYDIWYSVDGVTYETSDSLKFSDVADKNGPDSDFYKNGTFVEKDGTERNTVVHSIEMQGVYAKYIAIAVRGIAPGSSVNELVFHEITVDGKALDNKTASITEGTNTVYTSILADGETYSVDGAFIYALALDGIPSNGIFEIEVTPYFIPKGYDAKVYGETVSFKFIDGEIVRN